MGCLRLKGREIDFTVDKYNNPNYLSKRASVAQIINNALFMKSGNLPSHPDRYVDFEKILYQPLDNVNELDILNKLKNTCGESLVNTEISSLTLQPIRTSEAEYVILLIRLKIDNTDDLLAITIDKSKQDTIQYQYNFISEDVPI